MTICATAICRLNKKKQSDCILCISDRRITYGSSHQAETKHTTKGFGLSPANALAFYSGDSNAHFAIVTRTHQKAIGDDLKDVHEIANWYSENVDVFEKEKKKLAGVEAIIAGFDSAGPHIYRIDKHAQVDCFDGAGVCATGSGADWFLNCFEASGYDRHWNMNKTLWLMYEAKIQAQADPKVGLATDIFMLTSEDNGRLPKASRALEDYRKALDKKERKIIKRMKKDHRFMLPNN